MSEKPNLSRSVPSAGQDLSRRSRCRMSPWVPGWRNIGRQRRSRVASPLPDTSMWNFQNYWPTIRWSSLLPGIQLRMFHSCFSVSTLCCFVADKTQPKHRSSWLVSGLRGGCSRTIYRLYSVVHQLINLDWLLPSTAGWREAAQRLSVWHTIWSSLRSPWLGCRGSAFPYKMTSFALRYCGETHWTSLWVRSIFGLSSCWLTRAHWFWWGTTLGLLSRTCLHFGANLLSGRICVGNYSSLITFWTLFRCS